MNKITPKYNMINNNKVVAFWMRDSDLKTIPLLNIVGVERLMWRGSQKRQRVIFKVMMPDGNEFVKNIQKDGKVMLRYIETGNLDNPFNGELVCDITYIEFKEGWYQRLAPLEYSGEAVMAHISASCVIQWFMFEDFEEKHDES